MTFDTIIIGSGAAGLHTAMLLPKEHKTLIITKKELTNCNTYWAQGGISFAKDEDDIERFIDDTLKAGAGHCDKEAVEILAIESVSILKELLSLGFEFDKESDGALHFTKEGAHTTNRVLHAGGDQSGKRLHEFLVSLVKDRVEFLSNTTVFDLLMDGDTCYGVSIEHDGVQKNIYANSVVIASGGVGSLFLYHTNDTTISGELQGIAIEKGLEMADMEFLQFHPTVYVSNNWARKLLLSEALRGEGAEIVDKDGKRFLFDYDTRGELAPRDIVSRAIFEHKSKTKEGVYISLRSFKKEQLRARFPYIYESLSELGYSIPEDLVPISPAFHYAMGGIKTDLNGRVKNTKNLYAIGEAACTGVHGANRLASNSLLETLVFSKRAVSDIIFNSFEVNKDFKVPKIELVNSGDDAHKELLRAVMWEFVGVTRTKEGLKEALAKVDGILSQKVGRLLYLRVLNAKKIIECAQNREESLGAHYLKKGS